MQFSITHSQPRGGMHILRICARWTRTTSLGYEPNMLPVAPPARYKMLELLASRGQSSNIYGADARI